MKNCIDSIKQWLNPPRKTILVIDDSDVDRTFVERVLSGRYQVVTAANGQSGIDTARRQRPDLILLDYVMPGMSGPEVCRSLKNDRSTETIPVIFLTSMDDALSMSDGFEGGAEHYLTKPIGKSDLLGQVKLRLKPPVFH
jgi:CheY-like chemotaxis protein